MGKSYISYNWEDYSESYENDDQVYLPENRLRMNSRNSKEISRRNISFSPQRSIGRCDLDFRTRKSELSEQQ